MKSLEETGSAWLRACFWFWWHYADSLWIWLQRYSVAVYLVRVFTAADLFSQLKHCSVESAERCRERSKCQLHTHLRWNSSTAFVCFNLTDHRSLFQLLMSVVSVICSPRQTTIWSRKRNCNNGPPSLPHLPSEYTPPSYYGWNDQSNNLSNPITNLCLCRSFV